MLKITGKIVVTILLCFILTLPIIINTNVRGQEPATLRVDPPEQEIPVESFFDIFVWVDSFFDVFMDGIVLTYDTSIIDAIDVEAVPPFLTTNKIIDDEHGFMLIESVAEPPLHGSMPLAHFTFRCTGGGISNLIIAQYYLFDRYQNPIPIGEIINERVTQKSWYFKPPYPDYAPSGVPDFDQKQWGAQMWKNPFPPIGTWSYCGPVAVANSLWWLDSESEPNPIPPPIINDNFPLVQSYAAGVWDDHDPQNVPPLVEDLAFLMDTNGQRFGHQHCGTEVHEMTMGLNEYISRQGLDWKFYVHLQKAPHFLWIEGEIKKCQDVVLLLGFWQWNPYIQQWVRVGGHYVTCAGVNSANWMLAISDPYIDAAEMGLTQGRVLPPPPHPHTGIPETLHNDALYVSHDFYPIGPSPSPGGPFGFYEYPAEYVIDNFGSCQNTPDEFLEFDGEYLPGQPIFTEIEYAVVTSCKTGIVAAGSEDTNIYVWDFFGTLQWQFALGNPVVSVAMDNNGRYIAAGTRSPMPPITGNLWLFDNSLGAPPGNVLWATTLPVSISYDGGWAGTESKSVDVKYNYYNGYVVVAAATDQGLYLFDQFGSIIWQYWDQAPETIVEISQDGNYIICADYNTGFIHYFSHMRDGVPGWGPNDGAPMWTRCGGIDYFYAFWVAISGNGEYIAVSVYNSPMGTFPAGVVLFDRTGSIVWFYVLPKGGFVRVDMPCSGSSVVSVNDDPSDALGCDLNYWSDGGNGWDGGDVIPVWTFSSGIPTDDLYTVSISENGDYVATGGAPTNTYLLTKGGTLQQIIGLMPGAIQSADLTFSGKYGASVDNAGTIWFYNKDTGFTWSANPTQAPFHRVAVSKIYSCMFPYPDHDVTVTGIELKKTVVGQGYNANISITVTNEGDFQENFDVTLCANSTVIGTQTVNNLAAGTSIILNFSWDTTGYEKGIYTIWGFSSVVPDEIDVYDNHFIDSTIKVTIPGDVDGDFKVKMDDIVLVVGAFGSTLKADGWYWHTPPCVLCPHNPNIDVDGNGKVDMGDIVLACTNFGKTYP